MISYDLEIKGEGLIPLKPTELNMLETLRADDFKPSFSKIAKRTNVRVSTLFDRWKRLDKREDLDIKITITISRKTKKRV